MTYHCFESTLTSATKDHRCVWCFNKILTGSRYVREKSVYEGHFQNHPFHEQCLVACKEYCAYEPDGVAFVSGMDMPYFELYKLEVNTP